jgi:hypothetical protein
MAFERNACLVFQTVEDETFSGTGSLSSDDRTSPGHVNTSKYMQNAGLIRHGQPMPTGS